MNFRNPPDHLLPANIGPEDAQSRSERPVETHPTGAGKTKVPPGGTDVFLVQEAQRGDPEAFKTLFERYVRLVAVLFYQKISQPQEIEDLVQETFLKAWGALSELRDPRSFLPWLLRIAQRVATDWHRRVGREKATTGHLLDELAGRTAQGDAVVEAESHRRLLRALGKLPERYRRVVTLRFLEGLTPHQIATQLGEPDGTIRNRIFRGLQRLGRLFTEEKMSSQEGGKISGGN